MSSRIAGNRDKLLARPVRWPSLPLAPAAEIPAGQSQELRQALTESLVEVDELRGHVDDLEQALQAREQLGYERGLAEGRTQGRQEAAAQQQPVLDRMARAMADLALLRPNMRRQSEAGLIRLCVAIAHRILQHELRLDPEAIGDIVRAALNRNDTGTPLNIRVHPAQVEALRAQLSKLGVPETVNVEAVASMEEGGLVVETAAGAIDASLHTQIAEVERALTARFGA
jgi:flagellar assembly protein FliH